jgi:membrane-associated protein
VTHLADDLLRMPPLLALLLVFALPALEASAFLGFLVPAEPGVILGGVLANQHKLSFWAVLVAAVAGAVIGDSIGYEVGRRWGRRLTARIPHRVLRPERAVQAEDSVRRLGGRAVFVGRFTTTLRILVPGFAGMSRVPYREFFVWNAAGGAIWATSFVVLGFAAGSQYQRAAHNAALAGLVLVAVVGVVGTAVWWLRRRRPL